MRWDRLFDDLESQLEQELGAEQVDVIAEEERLRLGRLAMRERILAMIGGDRERRPLELVLRDGTPLRLDVRSTGRDWIAGERVGASGVGAGRSAVVPFDAIGTVSPAGDQLVRGLSAASAGAPDALAARLGLGFVLRDLCRRRTGVDVVCEWAILHGTLDRVGRDHVDLAEHDAGEPRRSGAVRGTRLVPFARILQLRF